jgi:hypothetical protein
MPFTYPGLPLGTGVLQGQQFRIISTLSLKDLKADFLASAGFSPIKEG